MDDKNIYPENEIFNRSHLLLGDETMEKLKNTEVIIFGIGGVGSWTAESLIRTGVRNLTIVDADTVAVSNINRQAPATTLTVGESKVEAMRHRLLQINPDANITAIRQIYSADTASEFDLEQYDYIIDAIDSLTDKATLIINATNASRPKLLSSMGAALKMDPTRIQVAEFWKVKGCRLAAALRTRFKRNARFPSRKFQCVFSDELLPNLGAELSERPARSTKSCPPCNSPMTFNKVATNGSLCHITAIFGMTLTGLLLQHITRQPAS